MRKQVEIFTDGSCLGNPGPGGYGAIMRYRQHEKTFSEGYFLTTNNRMELMAAIVAPGHYPMDPQLEKAWLENGREKTRQECRSLEAS